MEGSGAGYVLVTVGSGCDPGGSKTYGSGSATLVRKRRKDPKHCLFPLNDKRGNSSSLISPSPLSIKCYYLDSLLLCDRRKPVTIVKVLIDKRFAWNIDIPQNKSLNLTIAGSRRFSVVNSPRVIETLRKVLVADNRLPFS